ncbi:MAG: hypothetical protein M3T56_17825 [Chloroflexota bacterium]|nr:hypothetical protein [Chloroflexota bacterium]
MSSTLLRRAVTSTLVALALLLALVIPATPADAAAGKIIGKVGDSITLAPIQLVDVYLGIPGNFVWARTAVDGSFTIDLDAVSAQDHGLWEIYFVKPGYVTTKTNKFTSNGGYTFGQDPSPTGVPGVFPLVKQIVGPRSSCTDAGTGNPNPPALTSTVYLPNITRRLGGPNGFYTPFIIQNTGTSNTQLEVSFYKFTDGSCVERYLVFGMAPGTSHSNDPNDTVKNPSLPDDAQFSVVVQSFGSKIVGVVNEHQGTGTRAEALSYDGFTTGANTVYLPNITRKFFGLFDTPFIIQNLGTSTASVTSTFRSFDGTGPTVVIPRTIDPGRAKPIDPDSDDINLGAPGLTDNKQYAVTVQSNQPIAVVVNTQADKANVAQPVASATDGITTGAATIYGAYAAKNAQGVGRRSSIIVQNLGAAAATPTITFTPLTGSPGTANTYTFPSIAPNTSKAFDPRFSFSTQGTTNTPCSTGGADCLADGEYTIKIEAAGGNIAAQVNIETASTAMGYSATATPATKFFLPNLTKSLCFCPTPTQTTGWSTPILLQSVTATTVTVSWYNFQGGALAFTHTVNVAAGGGIRIDPWSFSQLAADKQYSVVVDGGTGTVTAIVSEFASGGDNAMMYEGFAAVP